MHADGKSTLASVSKWNSGKVNWGFLKCTLDINPQPCREFLAWVGNESVVPSWASPNWNYSQHGPEFQPGLEHMYITLNLQSCQDEGFIFITYHFLISWSLYWLLITGEL